MTLQQWNTVKAVSKAKSASKIPPWKVSKLFSSQAQRENTIGTHKSDAGPHEHIFPDFSSMASALILIPPSITSIAPSP